ncbi:MAG: fused MFS/spermidine synthase [Planctomycetota bacterium]
MTSDRPDPPAEGGRLAPGALLVVVALAGAATMVVELGAVRLLSPWFGTSSSVWTNVIGVVLAALALGYALGARLASGRDPLRTLGATLLVGALFAAWLPRLAPLVGEAFMPTGVTLDAAASLLVWGSLAAAATLFLPAATALGCAGPLAVEVLQRTRGGAAGRAGGHVLAASTLGSLAGTFGTTHVFVPSLGITRTFVLASVVLGLCAAALLAPALRGGSGRRVAGLLVVAAGLGAVLSEAGPRGRQPAESFGRELASMESALQSLRVVERGEGDERMRLLQVNESLDSFQSVWQPATGLLPPGHYYDHFALPYAWQAREDGGPPARWDVLVLGLGAGTAVRVLEGVVAKETDLVTVGIEIDPAVVELGERWFELESDGDRRVVVGGLDARSALRIGDEAYHQVIVDAYANNMEIPPHLSSVEAYAAIRERLADGGWLTVNVGGFGPDDPVVRAVAAAAAVGMESDVHVVRVPFSRNLTLFARRGGRVPRPGEAAFGPPGGPSFAGDVRSPAGAGLDALLPPLAIDGGWSTVDPEDARADAATDDTTAVEKLQLRSIRWAQERRAMLAARKDERGTGGAPVDGARDQHWLDEARRLSRERDFAGALEAAGSIGAPGPRAVARTEVVWSAGDPFRALETAIEGLGAAPDDLPLARLAVDLALVVGAARTADMRLADLRARLDAEALEGEPRAWWDREIERLGAATEEAVTRADDRDAALSRARLVSLVAAFAAAAAAAWALRQAVPAA